MTYDENDEDEDYEELWEQIEAERGSYWYEDDSAPPYKPWFMRRWAILAIGAIVILSMILPLIRIF